jgi:FKBP-type peptidyl-prolyl cis-trans isomerase
MNQQAVVGTFAALLLVACDRSPFPGFKPISDEVHFKLRMLGDGERLPTDSDSVLVRVRMALHGEAPGSLFSTEQWYGDMDAVLPSGSARAISFHEGDSVSLIAKAGRIPWDAIDTSQGAVQDSLWVDMELSLHALRSRAESRQLAEAVRMARTAADEDSTLARYFASAPGQWQRFMGVSYELDPKNPKTPKIQSGQVVTIAYTARFLEAGHLFDDTYTTKQPLTFRLGDPGQVIKGLEIAIHLLPEGGKGRFIIPSELAFGAQGSSSRIVPPWTPVLYEVEVMDAGEVAPVALLMDSAAGVH